MKNRQAVWGVALVAIWAASALPQKAIDIDKLVELRGVQVVNWGYEEGRELRPFKRSPGTPVAVVVHATAGGLLEFDKDASTITSFTSFTGDKKTDLLKKEGRRPAGAQFGRPVIGRDGKTCLVEITAPGVSAGRATKLRVRGTLMFLQATKKKTDTVADVDLKKGTEFTVGGIAFEISDAYDNREWSSQPPRPGETSWPAPVDTTMIVTLRTNADVSALAALRLVDAEGNELSSELSRTSTTKLKETTTRFTFQLKRKAETVGIAVDVRAGRTEFKVPFSVEATLGL